MFRKIPCNECKRRRRRCIWLPDFSSCERCQRLQKPCFLVDLGPKTEQYQDEEAEEQLQSWWMELSMLGKASASLEKELNSLSNMHLLSPTPESGQSDGEEPTWKLSVVDGKMFLESSISTLPELFSYYKASIRYLSPFSGLFEMNPIYFENTGKSVIPSVFQMMSRTIFSQENASTRRSNIPWPLPDLNPRDVAEELVHAFTTYKAFGGPYLHIPTFLAHYKSLDDPFSDAVTLAICVSMSWSAHRPNIFTASQASAIADYFYHQCLERLNDMFDDPSRQLETVVAANLLQHYAMLVRLDFSTARRLSTLCYLICNDLTDMYADSSIPLIKRVTFQRQHFFAVSMMQALDFSIDGRIKSDLRVNLPFLFLDDDSERLRDYEVYGYYLRLALSPYVVKFDAETQRINDGEVGELCLDAILGYRDFIKEWWSSLPQDMQLCSDPFSKDLPTLIDNASFGYQVLILAYVHELTMSIHSCLLKPRPILNVRSCQTELLEMLRREAVAITVHSTEILIYAVRRVNLAENMGLFCLKFLIKIMSVMSILAESSDSFISLEAQKALYDCSQQLKAASPHDHQVPLASSPLTDMFSLQPCCPSLRDTYKTYPLPGYAFFLDLMRHSMEYLRTYTCYNIE